MSDIDFGGLISVAAKIVVIAAKAMGETTEEISKRVLAQAKLIAADPTDETEGVAGEIDKHILE